MSTVSTKSISQVRNQLFSIADEETITAVTRNGQFVGILITSNFPTASMATFCHKRLKENPVNTITELTKSLVG